MTLSTLNTAQSLVLFAPVAIIVIMILVFRGLHSLLRPGLAYFLGFLIYWVVWCGVFPWLFLGTNGIAKLFQFPGNPIGTLPWLVIALLIFPILLAGLIAFPNNISRATGVIILLSLLIAVINAPAEELLWRGLFISVFPGNFILAYLYPSVGFGLWHIAPLMAKKSSFPGGMVAFVIGALIVGLCWGWVAFVTGSIFWTTVSHVIFDFLGLGALAYYREK